jgi:hypothetical protein
MNITKTKYETFKSNQTQPKNRFTTPENEMINFIYTGKETKSQLLSKGTPIRVAFRTRNTTENSKTQPTNRQV